MSSSCKVHTSKTDKLTRVEFNGCVFNTGLLVPKQRVSMARSVTDGLGLVAWDTIRKAIESQDWCSGQKLFDTSWITNQNGHGSCASYGAASALSKAIYRKTGKRIDLAGDYLYSLVNGGRDRGSMLDENMRTIMRRGVAERSIVKLGQIYRRRYDTAKADENALNHRAWECFEVSSEHEMATAMYYGYEVVVAIQVSRNWRKFNSEDILAPSGGRGNHCEHCDDMMYSTTAGKLLFRKGTSHGTSYSDDGYCWTTWDDHYAGPNRYHMFYAVPTSLEIPYHDLPRLPDGYDTEPIDEDAIKDDIIINMESRNGCGWCDKWLAEIAPLCNRKGWTVRITKDAQGRVPRFTLSVNGDTTEKTGYWYFNQLEEAVNARLSSAA